MKTEIIKIDADKIDDNIIDRAVEILRAKELVAFPTETVYGLGADGLEEEAIRKIFLAKNRPQDNPLILHVSSIEMLERLVDARVDEYRPLLDRFWPGPLTIILKRSDLVPDAITAGLDTVAIRMPKNRIALELIRKLDRPIAAPSANLSGKPSPTDGQTVFEDMEGKIPLVLDGGRAQVGLESTVLDLTSPQPTILRPGGITLEMLREIYPDTGLDKSLKNRDFTPKSPGQKYTHYKPEAKVYLVDGSLDEKIKKIKGFLQSSDKKTGIMATEELLTLLNYEDSLDMGSVKDLEKIAQNIFFQMREMDKGGFEVILIEAVEEKDLGLAIMNRLKKSSGEDFL